MKEDARVSVIRRDEAKPNNIHFEEFQYLKNDDNHLIISGAEQIK